MRDDQLQRLEELISQPDMVPCMPLLRADVAALLAELKQQSHVLPPVPTPEPKLNFFD